MFSCEFENVNEKPKDDNQYGYVCNCFLFERLIGEFCRTLNQHKYV